MIGNKKVIGVCITRIQESMQNDYLNCLYALARQKQYKLMVFNSFSDFHRQDAFDQGAMSVYDLLDYQLLDAVVVAADAFADQAVAAQLVDACKAQETPVVVVNGRQEGVWQVRSDFQGAFREMLTHLIQTHGVQESCLFTDEAADAAAGSKLDCYRQVLAENGLPFSGEQVYHCRIEDTSAKETVFDMLQKGKPPRAIICTRDYLAFAVCDALRRKGYRVPEDVIVTGFDGLVTAFWFIPQLTTCSQPCNQLAVHTLAAVEDALAGTEEPSVRINPYVVSYGESCGCKPAQRHNVNETICNLYKTIAQTGIHEDEMYNWIDRVLGMEDVAGLYQALANCVLDDSYVCLETEIFQLDREQFHQREKQSGDELMVIASANQTAEPGALVPLKRSLLLPDLEQWEKDETLYIINAVYAGKEPCGYYAVRTDDVIYHAQKIKRVLKTINVAVNAALNDCRQRNMRLGLENAMLTDPISGLPNMKGAQRWFEAFSQQPENRRRAMAISVYGIPMYTYIYEHYGMGDVEELLTYIASALREAYQADSYIARIADNEFVVISHYAASNGIEDILEQASARFFAKIAAFNEHCNKAYYLEVNNGYSVVDPGWNGSLDAFVRYAVGEMYLNRMRSGENPVVKESHSSEDYYSAFNLLLEKNLFTYHFQPIVDARSGNIYAYEALMRTSGGINMSPLDVLDIARKYGRLYEIEKITLFNILRHYVEHYEEFGGHMLFINTIPGHFLNEEDCAQLMELYGEYMDHVIFELTEQNTISDSELKAIRRLRKDGEPAQIAVDDYGTGHSNIVNLLRYAPQVIKIDRYLISEIQNDTNKQMFVKNTIEFARLNGIKTLAEGVETFDELQTVIEYGMDLVQGYYLGRPIANPVVAIQDQVKNEIVSKNIRLSKLDSDMRAYTAKAGETVNLLDLAISKYGFIDVFGGEVTLVGEKDHTVDMVVRVADNVKATLVMQNANFKGATETTVQIGSGCQITLVLAGDNTLHKEGVLVPATSTLTVEGDGTLKILASRNDGVGIGANFGTPYGSLVFRQTGSISIEASGDKVVGIGGKTSKQAIELKCGSFHVEAKGINVVGIGSTSGNADIRVEDAHVHVQCAGDEAVSIGSVSGRAKIKSTGVLDVVTDSERAVGIGSLSGRESELHFTRGIVNAVNHCYMGTCIGSFDGSISIYCTGAGVDVYGEGNRICGIGSLNGKAQTIVSSGALSVDFLAGTVLALGNENCQLTVNGGNVLTNNFEVSAKNLFGTKLQPVAVDEDTFEKQIDTELGSYIYRAQKDEKHRQLVVFLPEE